MYICLGVSAGQSFCIEIQDNAEGGSIVIMSDVVPTTRNVTASKAALGAAAAGAVLGTLLMGPITGVVVAGAALYASTRDDKIGDAARGTGRKLNTVNRRPQCLQ
jgi:hypothetical protein